MKKQTKIILVIVILVASLFAQAPWITDEYAINKVKANTNFIKQHAGYEGIEDIWTNIFWLPFGRGVATGEGLWYVSFSGIVI